MRALKLMADYDCFPLWEASPGVVGNVDPESLPISEDLKCALAYWAKAYDDTLNRDDPSSSGFRSKQAEDAFCMQGNQLLPRLKKELGPDYSVLLKIII